MGSGGQRVGLAGVHCGWPCSQQQPMVQPGCIGMGDGRKACTEPCRGADRQLATPHAVVSAAHNATKPRRCCKHRVHNQTHAHACFIASSHCSRGKDATLRGGTAATAGQSTWPPGRLHICQPANLRAACRIPRMAPTPRCVARAEVRHGAAAAEQGEQHQAGQHQAGPPLTRRGGRLWCGTVPQPGPPNPPLRASRPSSAVERVPQNCWLCDRDATHAGWRMCTAVPAVLRWHHAKRLHMRQRRHTAGQARRGKQSTAWQAKRGGGLALA